MGNICRCSRGGDEDEQALGPPKGPLSPGREYFKKRLRRKGKHQVLQEEILLKKQNVAPAVQNYVELLKPTTGDEVVVIQDKLEGIKARYKDITKLNSDASKTLEQTVQLSEQLQTAHEELCTWLDKVEPELISSKTQIPKGQELNEAQDRQRELKQEAKQKRSLLDTLNEVSSGLLELVPWRAREGIDKMVTKDNIRYRLVSDTITQKVEEIDAALLKSQQVLQNDVLAHQSTVEAVKKAGNDLIQSSAVEEASNFQSKLELLNQRWQNVWEKTEKRKQQLDSALIQVLQEEILLKKQNVAPAVQNYVELLKPTTGDEVVEIQDKLEGIKARYKDITKLNSDVSKNLEQTVQLSEQLQTAHEELCTWLDKVEPELISSKTQIPKGQELNEAQDRQRVGINTEDLHESKT